MEPIVWRCICGYQTSDPTKAFTHRDGTNYHQIVPQLATELEPGTLQLTGIERNELEEELNDYQ